MGSAVVRVGVSSGESRELVIDRHSLSIDGGCELRGLSGDVRIRAELAHGQLWYLRVLDSPGLRYLDLRECPGGFDLEIEGSSHCGAIEFPSEGACLLILVTGDFPGCGVEGRVEECRITISEAHEVPGFYRIESTDGLVLMADGVLEPHRGIDGYLRIDQCGGGLQFKRLRPRTAPDDIVWQLLDSRGGASSIPGQLTLMQSDEFSRLCLRTDPDNRARTGNDSLFLTMLGGGAFGNRDEWIANAIVRAAWIHAGCGLDVRIVSYGRPQVGVAGLMDQFRLQH